nr:YraN family protein [Pedobacter sp.]
MARHNDLGKRGEQLARQFLIQRGYEILDENWVFERAEIDLIAYINRIIVFVEVKTRSSTGFGLPED